MFTLDEICALTGGKLLRGNGAARVKGVHFDSRQVQKGFLFVALTSGKRDGHTFIADAAANGAAAALVSNPSQLPGGEGGNCALVLVENTEKAFQTLARAYRRKLNIPFIAITGSNGKTTTKDMVAHVLAAKYKVRKTHKNFNNHLGVPLSILQVQPDDEAAVLELGMNHPGEIDFLASLVQPDISIITNVNDAHIEFFGSREKIAQAKGELLPHTKGEGFVLLNKDDPFVAALERLSPAPVYYFGLEHKDCDIRAFSLANTDEGTLFHICAGGKRPFGDEPLLLPLFGRHNVYNVLPALFVGLRFAIAPETIRAALRNLQISQMRFQVIQSGDGVLIINDAYNASPASMKEAVQTFMQIYPERKKVAVLGDMFELGKLAESYHREVGTFLNRFAAEMELLVTVGEKARWIYEEYAGNKLHCPDKEEAAKALRPYRNEAHALFFKASRGMQLETIVDALLNG
ncbi:UDP-N-acetylmuramoyl-tripeptide--D-alanyl-D-alanine ligase [Bacillaceae bacterium]